MTSFKQYAVFSLVLCLVFSGKLGDVAEGNVNIGQGNTILSSGNFVKGDGNIVASLDENMDIFGDNPMFAAGSLFDPITIDPVTFGPIPSIISTPSATGTLQIASHSSEKQTKPLTKTTTKATKTASKTTKAVPSETTITAKDKTKTQSITKTKGQNSLKIFLLSIAILLMFVF